MIKLGINLDHIATLRQARKEFDPDPANAAQICEQAGADSIVAHLREDRRHIQDSDIFKLKKIVKTRFNLEMSLNKEIVQIAARLKPHQVTLVPERRQELTTEGGLDVVGQFTRVIKTVEILKKSGTEVSLFIAPVKNQIIKSKEAGVKIIELHTGKYAVAKTPSIQKQEIKKLKKAAEFAIQLGLTVNAGHGLKYHNTKPVAQIPGINELNIGHSIISRAVFVGLKQAVKEMLTVLKKRTEPFIE